MKTIYKILLAFAVFFILSMLYLAFTAEAQEVVFPTGAVEIPILGVKMYFHEDVNYFEIQWDREIFDSRFVRIDKYRVRSNGEHVREKVIVSKAFNSGSYNEYWLKKGLNEDEYIRIDVYGGSEHAIYIGNGVELNNLNIETLLAKGKLVK